MECFNMTPDNKIMDYVVGLEKNLLKAKEENERLKLEIDRLNNKHGLSQEFNKKLNGLTREWFLDKLSKDENGWMDAIPMQINDDDAYRGYIRVIEYSSYDQLKSNLKIAVEALEFYADRENWTLDYEKTKEANANNINAAHGVYTSIYKDSCDSGGVSLGHITNSVGGNRARQALSKIGEL